MKARVFSLDGDHHGKVIESGNGSGFLRLHRIDPAWRGDGPETQMLTLPLATVDFELVRVRGVFAERAFECQRWVERGMRHVFDAKLARINKRRNPHA
jgi:hypothetical protein